MLKVDWFYDIYFHNIWTFHGGIKIIDCCNALYLRVTGGYDRKDGIIWKTHEVHEIHNLFLLSLQIYYK